jgi:hypothetical protein
MTPRGAWHPAGLRGNTKLLLRDNATNVHSVASLHNVWGFADKGNKWNLHERGVDHTVSGAALAVRRNQNMQATCNVQDVAQG